MLSNIEEIHESVNGNSRFTGRYELLFGFFVGVYTVSLCLFFVRFHTFAPFSVWLYRPL
jgi:hypothetical protein